MRTAIRLILLIGVPLALALMVLAWYAQSQRYVTTDNAYVKSNLVAISPSMDGRVIAVHVSDDQLVRQGELLFTLDRRPHEIALARANAALGAVRNDIASMQARYAQAQAALRDATERVKHRKRRLAREIALTRRGMSSASRLDDAEYEVKEAAERVRGLESQVRQALAELGGDARVEPERHPRYLEALAARAEATLSLEYTKVRAPTDGIVSRMKLQAGEWLESGRTVFMLIEHARLWVEANLKETQLTDVTIGQSVALRLDAYPAHEWLGRIVSISGATGSEFLVLPAQNATGNWVKVVQRLPVRIELEPAPNRPTLRAGMTVTVSIDTGKEGELLSLVRETTASLGLN